MNKLRSRWPACTKCGHKKIDSEEVYWIGHEYEVTCDNCGHEYCFEVTDLIVHTEAYDYYDPHAKTEEEE